MLLILNILLSLHCKLGCSLAFPFTCTPFSPISNFYHSIICFPASKILLLLFILILPILTKLSFFFFLIPVCQQKFAATSQQKSLIWGAERGETWFRRTVCRPEKRSLWRKPEVCSTEVQFYRERVHDGSWFYAHEDSKFAWSDWFK